MELQRKRRLEGKVAIVTGAGCVGPGWGNGRATAYRFAQEGFVALAPDLYRGKTTREPDEAAKLMMALNIEQAAKDMVGAVDFLTAHEAVTSQGVGVTGFCMGGALDRKSVV